MKRILLAVLLAVVLVVAALAALHLIVGRIAGQATEETPELSVPEGFQHEGGSFEAAGFYSPKTEVKVGDIKLNHLAIGARSDFESWEAGEREGVFGPVLIQFDDLSSPMVTNELGAEGHEKTVRVLPTAYQFYPGEVRFKGTAEGLGEVIFAGKFDQAALASAAESGASGDAAVLTGDLRIGEQTFAGVQFSYWTGD